MEIKQNRICQLFNIQFPIVQGGMVWCSGWRLASAVSNQGGLGLIGAGSMHPETLREHIRKTKNATTKPFGVNVPLFYPQLEEIMNIIVDEKVPIVFTSAGNPKNWTNWLQQRGVIVAHVISNSTFAEKCEHANVDAIVAEGFEAGGHNGREETSTLCLIPSIRKCTSLPLLAAGGIGNGESIYAAMALGADGVQIGSRFAITTESSAHENFKKHVLTLKDGDTQLCLKQISPVRLIKNEFFNQIIQAETRGASKEELIEILGKRRSKLGIFEGNLIDGELEIGQNSAYFTHIKSVEETFSNLINEFRETKKRMQSINL